MDQPLRVLFASPEAVPFAKTGGLADVAGALPKYLQPLGCDLKVVMPYYRMVKKSGLPLQDLGEEIDVPVLYATQVLGLALGLDRKALGLQRHFVEVSM